MGILGMYTDGEGKIRRGRGVSDMREGEGERVGADDLHGDYWMGV